MSLTLNLDDRRWADLVEEGRALIPAYAPEWTDHNVHDPGITVLELLAWIAEMDVFQVNRIPDSHRREFLALAGVRPQEPRPAQTLLAITSVAAGGPVLPANIEFETDGFGGQPIRFRSLEDVACVAATIGGLQSRTAAGFDDLTTRRRRGEDLSVFGSNPAAGAAMYIGFDTALPPGQTVTIFALSASPATPNSRTPARVQWEYLDNLVKWRPLTADQVEDGTFAFTITGSVRLTIPGVMGKREVGVVKDELYYVRCRMIGGAFDAAPTLRAVEMNGVWAEQAVPAGTLRWVIDPDAVIEGPLPEPGHETSFDPEFTARKTISKLTFSPGREPSFHVLEFVAPAGSSKGVLAIQAERLGTGDGAPEQEFALADAPILAEGIRICSLEAGAWISWSMRDHFLASGPRDAHFHLDADSGTVLFGDGAHGRTLPSQALVIASYRATAAHVGNVSAQHSWRLADSASNRSLPDFDLAAATAQIDKITNPVAASGGARAESLQSAAGRVLETVELTDRAITLADYERLALATPGTTVARVAARANLHPGFPCFSAPGVVTVLVVPYLPLRRPEPSASLLRSVAGWLIPRRPIGTRVEVVGPEYRKITARAHVRALRGSVPEQVEAACVSALHAFFNPITGGPEGNGWPFGRDVYRSEVMAVLDQTPGVDHVLSLALFSSDTSEPRCGNVCIGPLGLVDSGAHEISVT